MIHIKKLFFAPLSLIALYFLVKESGVFLSSYTFIFTFDFNQLINLVLITLALVFSSLFIVLFLGFSNSWKYALTLALVVFISFEFLFYGNVFIAAGLALSILISYPLLKTRLDTYLNFQPIPLFAPSIKTLAQIIILVLAISFYFGVAPEIRQNGFQIPDALINTALQLSTPENTPVSQPAPSLPQVSPEQLQLLKQNPALLRQYGIDPSVLNEVSSTSKTSNQTSGIKSLIQNQLQSLIKPYEGVIAPFLALLFFLTLYSFFSIISLILYPLIWMIFYILEKSGFIKFEKEMREVKKMVI